MNRSRVIYLLLIASTIILGLLSRKFGYYFPEYVNSYLGDALWALMVFQIFGIIFPKQNSLRIAFVSISFCFVIEISQLYHAAWIDNIRANRLGGLILGFGFMWTDLFAYNLGVGFGTLLEILIHKTYKKNENHNTSKH